MTHCISILGSTGSIGMQTLDVVDALGLRVAALAAGRNVDRIEQQTRKYLPRLVVLYDEAAAGVLRERLRGLDVEVRSGMDGLLAAAQIEEADTVLTAVVGMVGLRPTLAAIEKREKVAPAKKETLVCAGERVMADAGRRGQRPLTWRWQGRPFQRLGHHASPPVHPSSPHSCAQWPLPLGQRPTSARRRASSSSVSRSPWRHSTRAISPMSRSTFRPSG